VYIIFLLIGVGTYPTITFQKETPVTNLLSLAGFPKIEIIPFNYFPQSQTQTDMNFVDGFYKVYFTKAIFPPEV
jgi:hypothetical protein